MISLRIERGLQRFAQIIKIFSSHPTLLEYGAE